MVRKKSKWAEKKRASQYEDIDTTKLKYVLYARKSSEDEQKQEHSIPDQVKLCKEYAERNGLTIVDIVKESKSAKIAGNRPEFERVLKELKKGKYDGILAWHPDRLARNMLEAGQIIDMLDNWEIKDLQFCQHHFDNNASGKMMLGMMFVFSKQYSDALSERVQRGVDTNVERGLSNGARKWGYIRDDETGQYLPDDNYDIIKKGWEMRLDGKSCRSIWEFFKENNVSRTTKTTKKTEKMRSKTSVENIFNDPFYYGVLVQSDNEIHLCEHYDFKPMITEEEYEKAQAIGYGEVKKHGREGVKANHIFLPLRDMVYCGVCGGKMQPGRHMPGDKSGRVLHFECRNKNCHRKPKAVMAQVVFDQIYALFDSIKFDEATYEEYSKQLDGITTEKIIEIKQQIKSKRAVINNVSRDINRKIELLEKATNKLVVEKINKEIEELATNRDELEEQCEDLAAKIKNPNRIKLSKDAFLNLANSLGDKMRNADAVQKDLIARKIFVNLVLDDKKRLTYRGKEPFDVLLSMGKPNLVDLTGLEPVTLRM